MRGLDHNRTPASSAAPRRCLLEIGPIALVRGHRRTGTGGPEAFPLAEYVNDRRVHEAVFGVLALESEPVDPRL